MRKKKLFVVGYDGDDEAIYGIKACVCGCGNKVAKSSFIDPLTVQQVKKELLTFSEKAHPKPVIYKLVKVDPKTLEVKK